MTGRAAAKLPDAGPQRPVVSSKHPEARNHDRTSGHARPDSPSVRSLGVSSVHCHVSRTRHNPPASDQRPMPASSLLLLTRRAGPTETSVRSLIVTSIFFCLGRRRHCWTIHTLWADTSTVKFLTLAQMCQPPSVSPCAHVLAYFHKYFQGC